MAKQAAQLDLIDQHIRAIPAQTPEASRIRTGWIMWFDQLGWMEKNASKSTLAIAKGRGNAFAKANGASFGADRPTIRQGSKGKDVADWQKIIGATSDGNFGPATKTKTIEWQRKNGLSADGVVGPATWAKAESSMNIGLTDADRAKVMDLVALTSKQSYDQSQQLAQQQKKQAILNQNLKENVPGKVVAHPTIRKGSRGTAVKEWQGILKQKVDGVFGTGTEAATKNFQSNHKLKADGIVGPQTWMAAYTNVAAATNAPTPAVVVDSTQTLPPANAPSPAKVLDVAKTAPRVAKKPVGQPIPTNMVPSVMKKAPSVAPSLSEVMNSPATATGESKIGKVKRTHVLIGAVLGLLGIGIGGTVYFNRKPKRTQAA